MNNQHIQKQIIKEFLEKCHLEVGAGGFLRFPYGKNETAFLDERLMGIFIEKSISTVWEEAEKETIKKVEEAIDKEYQDFWMG